MLRSAWGQVVWWGGPGDIKAVVGDGWEAGVGDTVGEGSMVDTVMGAGDTEGDRVGDSWAVAAAVDLAVAAAVVRAPDSREGALFPAMATVRRSRVCTGRRASTSMAPTTHVRGQLLRGRQLQQQRRWREPE